MKMNLEEWIKYIEEGMNKGEIKNKCCWCGSPLHAQDLKRYPHGDGWTVDGEGKQWLYIPCRKCGYEWAIWKLGVDREW